MAIKKQIPEYVFTLEKWKSFDKAEREYRVWRRLSSHTRYATMVKGLAEGIPFPKFLTDIKYYSVNFAKYPDKNVFTKAFSLTKDGRNDKDACASYNAWYSYEAPFTLSNE